MKAPILIIQTAFIGDAILATSFLKEVKRLWPEHPIHLLVRQDVATLLEHHGLIDRLWVWNKSKGKYLHLFSLWRQMRLHPFEIIFNLQRFSTMAFLALALRAQCRVGFKTWLTRWFFTKTYLHQLPMLMPVSMPAHVTNHPSYGHEVQRNAQLLQHWDASILERPLSTLRPQLYSTPQLVLEHNPAQAQSYIVIGPCSVWKTKQWPATSWAALIVQQLNVVEKIFLVGSPGEMGAIDFIIQLVGQSASEALSHNLPVRLFNMAGKLSLHQTALLLKNASQVYANDSALLHLASAVNTPVTAIFCSTLPSFGFFPLSDQSRIWETSTPLPCRPCGVHGKNSCPLKHFECAQVNQMMSFADSKAILDLP